MKLHNFAWALFLSIWFCGVHGKNDVVIDTGTKHFNLRTHLTTPLQSEIEAGVHNSRRLARNHIRLGIAEEHHRKLYPENPPPELVTTFNESLPIPSEGPKLDIDNFSDPLPFGDGPGVKPGIPQGTRDFWLGGGNPTKAWETVACPVADVKSYLADPLRCIFSAEGDGSLMNLFVQAIKPETIANVLTKGIIPLAVDALWAISPAGKLANILKSVCDLLGFIDDVLDIVGTVEKGVEKVKKAGEGATKWFKGAVKDIGDFLGFGAEALSQDLQPGDELAPCDNDHLATCRNDTSGIDCRTCNYTIPNACGECRTCYRPFSLAIPDMDGICLDTAGVKELVDPDNVFSSSESTALFTVLLARYLGGFQGTKGKVAEEVSPIISAQTTELQTTISETCAVPTPRPTSRPTEAEGRRLFDFDAEENNDNEMSYFVDESEHTGDKKGDERISEFLDSDGFSNIKETIAKKHGMTGRKVEDIFKSFHNNFASTASYEDIIKDNLKGDPAFLAEIEKMVEEEIKKNPEKYEKQLKVQILQNAMNPDTGVFDVERLRGIRATVASIQDGDIDFVDGNLEFLSRNLEEEKNATSLEKQCNDFIEGIEKDIKDFVEDALIAVIEQITNSNSSIFENSETADKVGEGLTVAYKVLSRTANAGGFMLMPIGFTKLLDPYGSGAALRSVLSLVIEVLQLITCGIMFGIDDENEDPLNPKPLIDQCEERLPSYTNKVLPIQEMRNGEVYMNSGCNSDFETELTFYKPLATLLIDLFDAAGDAVIEFYNIPIIVIRYLLQATWQLWEHMDNVCAVLDSYVQLAKVEATYENTRLTLREVACRNLDGGLQRGHGCDGIDNDCDEYTQIDECDEDVIPPDIFAAIAVANCEEKIFATEEDGLKCVSKHIVAEDDCKPVKLDVSILDGTEGSCDPTVEVKAVAQDCGEREKEDTTVVEIPIKVDGESPLVTCNILEQHLEGNGAYEDILFSYRIADDCDMKVDVKVEVFSNELDSNVDEMVFLSDTSSDLKIFVHDKACGKNDDCKISNYPKTEKSTGKSTRKSTGKSKGEHFPISREYQVQISATDSGGNKGMATCSTFVSTDTSDGNPLFPVASAEFELVVGDTLAPTFFPSSKPSFSPTSKGKGKNKDSKKSKDMLEI